ncbi:MAG: protein translocase subunit SecF [Patescibacteria group bacterium]
MNPKLWFWISLITIAASVLIIVLVRPLWGIDFVGGSLLEVKAPEENLEKVQVLLEDTFSISSTIQPTPEGTLIIRTPVLTSEQHQKILGALTAEGLAEEELRFEAAGPTIGAALRRQAIVALVLSIVLMIAYLAYTFRGAAGLTNPWKFGVAAVYAVLHDLLLVTAIFALLGKTWNVPVDSLFVTALLAIFGYSVNDTIVLFNRMATNWVARRSGNLLTNIDQAIRETLMRSINTSMTILLVLVTMLLFGGTTLRWFVVALTLGTITGAYSTIFVATPCLYYLTKRR